MALLLDFGQNPSSGEVSALKHNWHIRSFFISIACGQVKVESCLLFVIFELQCHFKTPASTSSSLHVCPVGLICSYFAKGSVKDTFYKSATFIGLDSTTCKMSSHFS